DISTTLLVREVENITESPKGAYYFSVLCPISFAFLINSSKKEPEVVFLFTSCLSFFLLHFHLVSRRAQILERSDADSSRFRQPH
uniref:Uncharacterized protein n=1 Tax=Oryza brachyantha TaxID=4533 RepID=J3N9Z8_ORYBR